MKWSLYVGKISGIKIFIHWTFLILILFVIQTHIRQGHGFNEIMLGLGFIIAVFACVTLHELGHALAAKRYHFKTKDINLLPIGGVARMEGLPEKPVQELVVAIMGPVVNIAISIVLFLALKLSNAFPTSMQDMHVTGVNFWYTLYAVNLFLALFNLIPAFPMDGGRVFRALLSLKLPRIKATRVAAYTGQFIAMLFVFLGFIYNPMLIFIGLFIFLGAQAETSTEETKAGLSRIKVSDVVMHRYSVLKPDEPLSHAVSLLLDSQETSFIVKDKDEIKGILSRKEIISGLSNFGKNIPVEKIMATEFPDLQTSDQLSDVIQKFSDGRHTLIPVFENKKFVGVLDMENISEYLQVQDAIHKS